MQERYIAILEELLRAKDEIARLRQENERLKKECETYKCSEPPLKQSSPPNDSLIPFTRLLRSRYAYFTSLTPAQKHVVADATERYMATKLKRPTYDASGKPAIPMILKEDFLAWFQEEVEGGLLESQPPLQKRLPERNEVGKDDGPPPAKRQASEATAETGEDRIRASQADINELGLKAWTKLVRETYPNWKNLDSRATVFTKNFFRTYSLPDYRVRGCGKQYARALPASLHQTFMDGLEKTGLLRAKSHNDMDAASQGTETASQQPEKADNEYEAISADEEEETDRAEPTHESTFRNWLSKISDSAPMGVASVGASPSSSAGVAMSRNSFWGRQAPQID